MAKTEIHACFIYLDENIMLNKANQIQKDKYMTPIIWNIWSSQQVDYRLLDARESRDVEWLLDRYRISLSDGEKKIEIHSGHGAQHCECNHFLIIQTQNTVNIH